MEWRRRLERGGPKEACLAHPRPPSSTAPPGLATSSKAGRARGPASARPPARWATRPWPGLGSLPRLPLPSRWVLDLAGCVVQLLALRPGAPHAGMTLRTRPAVRPGTRSVPRTARKRQAACRPRGCLRGDGDSLDRVCEDPPPVSDPGPGLMEEAGRAGQGRPSPAEQRRAYSQGPIVA